MEEKPRLEPSILTIFGITGDLAKRKILPSLYYLCKDNLLPDGTKIIGISRRELDVDEIINTVKSCIVEEGNVCKPEVINRLKSWITTFKLDLTNDDDYAKLSDYLNEIEEKAGVCLDRIFYLAIPPQVYGEIIEFLGKHKLNDSCRHGNAKTKLMIEKPFGFDVTSAEQLISDTEKVFSESQIYRVDHYLAKETAQNIIRFRQHNPLFTNNWNGKHIKHIHVISKEKIGIENRVSFYEQVGAMRDLIQNHLMQLMSLAALNVPDGLTPKEVHTAKFDFLSTLIAPSSIKDISKQAIRGQYIGYKDEVKNPHSKTETFASLILHSSDPRWEGCSFQLTTGKALDEKLTAILIYFGQENSNVLSFRIYPDEGIDIELVIERPGFSHELDRIKMNFSYDQHPSDTVRPNTSYERVLLDAIRGDKLLFASKDEVMASWQILEPVLKYWQQGSDDLIMYPAGSEGPDISYL